MTIHLRREAPSNGVHASAGNAAIADAHTEFYQLSLNARTTVRRARLPVDRLDAIAERNVRNDTNRRLAAKLRVVADLRNVANAAGHRNAVIRLVRFYESVDVPRNRVCLPRTDLPVLRVSLAPKAAVYSRAEAESILYARLSLGYRCGDRIGVVLLCPIHNRLSREIELTRYVGYATPRSDEFGYLMPECGRIGPGDPLGHGGAPRCKPESLHETGPASVFTTE